MRDDLEGWVGHPLRAVGAYGAYEVDVARAEALLLWRRLCSSADGHVPVFVEHDASRWSCPPSAAQLTATLQEAQRVFDELLQRDERMRQPQPVGPGPALTNYMLASPGPKASWAGLRAALEANRELRVPDDPLDRYDEAEVEAEEAEDDEPTCLGEEEERDIRLWVVPASTGWSLPAVFNFGGFNACPPSPKHAAVLQRWAQRYGARLLGIGHDWLEAEVERPPTSAREALQLALEHHHYCTGDGQELPVEELASELLGARHWFFWWD